ncbi:MAG: hypothetical protein K8W52_10860, partial [Deltaproteobacteria bacterium]|nr:hypothetical protein [Deltaproteobacteria bacterium]
GTGIGGMPALVARAHHLLDVREWADAKQLAVEALMRSPGGPSAADAQEIIRIANQRLGIVDPPPPTPGNPAPTDPITDPVGPIPPPATGPVDAAPHARGRVVLTGYGAASGAVIGLGFGGAAGSNGGEAAGAIIGGLAGGALGYWVGGKRHTSVASARTFGVGATWGGIALAFMADAVGGSNQPTTHHDVFIGAALGTGIGAAGGLWLARTHPLTADGATIVDSFGGLGVAGGLAIGELMQPYATEAYSLNAALGAAGGALVGLYVASNHTISSRRMARVDGIAALGGAAPWLLYAAIQTKSSTADERICGLLSAGGLVAGLWLGFRVTRKLDQPRVAPTAPTVEVGALGIRPASTPLAPSVGRGMIVDLARATW